MAQGGGRGKGRPKKTIATMTKTVTELRSGEQIERIESSRGGKSNETVTELITDLVEAEQSEVETHEEESTTKEEDVAPKEQSNIPLRNRGMKLGYVAPTLKNGIPTACLEKTELETEALKWKNAIILYVLGEAPTITYLANFLQQQCHTESRAQIFYHNEGYFVVKFGCLEDKEKMLYEGPYSIASRPVIVKEWMMDFNFEKEILREIPLWVQLPKLPLNCWGNDSLSRIASVLGKPICADECTTQQHRISYARMLIEIDVTQPRKYTIPVEGENGLMIEQKVFYEWAPLYCKKCQKVGHVCKEMQKPLPQAPIQKQWQKVQSEKGKDIVIEEQNRQKPQEGKETNKEQWQIPKKTISNSVIQVGNIQVTTSNGYKAIEQEEGTSAKGGDRIPFTHT